MTLRTNRILEVFAVTAVATAIFAAGCGSSGDSDEAKNAAVLNSINILDSAGLHGIDDAINMDKEIPANARTTAQKLQAVTALTEWPEELEDDAEALEATFAEMVTALTGDNPDMAKAGEAAAKAHDVEHDFSAAVWAHLYEEADVEVEGGSGH